MKFLSFIALASMAMAAPSNKKRADALDVTIEQVGNTEVRAIIRNNGVSNLKVLKTGTILDSSATEKVQVFQNNEEVPFDGLRVLVSTENLDEDAFRTIAAGTSIEVTFDIAELHDLAAGGSFDIVSAGVLPTAEADSTTITGAIAFASNPTIASVDGVQASAVREAHINKRFAVQSDCTGTRLTTINNAISVCRTLASAAQSAANSDNARMVDFFKSSSSSTKSTVSQVFSRIASACGSTSSGQRTYCSDVYGACSGGVIAYTLPSQSYMAYCPYFFNSMPLRGSGCYSQAQGNTVVHEATHLTQIKGTSDYGGYGYNFVKGLTAAQNLNHADTYTLFAQSIAAGC
ncbi:neutral protease 2-like protein [Microdochium bolleyi]|uniref:Neutral protease 2 n=1 Tax=Microdochium bolleyi TaxID=196109 RepID=A0A136IND2_9PEZI|nr:neutral protease 2-like protein [Microdochium bolleyi]